MDNRVNGSCQLGLIGTLVVMEGLLSADNALVLVSKYGLYLWEAFILIAVIAIKMFLSTFEIHIGHGVFSAILAIIFGYTNGLHYYRKKYHHVTANM